MKYKVYWTRTAVKDLKKLEKKIAERVLVRVEEASMNPFRYFKKLRALPFYSLRVGAYRVIVSIDHGKGSIVVLSIEHRCRVYKKIK